MIKFTADHTFVLAAEGDNPRTISGIAVPWGVVATVSDGQRVKFERGSLPVTGKKPKLLKYHDSSQIVGVVTGRLDSEDGMLFTAKISSTTDGNDMLELVKDEAIDSVSVGVDVKDARYDDDGTMVISSADWVELSLVAAPAFKGATITEVAATEAQQETSMSDKVEATPETPAPAPAPQLIWAEAKREFKLPSAAEYISKILRGGSEAQQFLANLRAGAPDVVTTDTPGILPEPILAPVYNNFRGLRPVVDAIGVRAMPGGGKVFRRPKVTTHTTIGESNGENAALDAGTFVVSNNDVTKTVYGGYVKLSEEDMDWTEPAVLSLMLDDMARIYANTTDNVAADALVSGTSNTAVWADFTDPVEAVTFVYECAADILNNSNGNLPTHLFVAPNVWQSLGQMVDTADRPLFPQVGPMNAFGNVQPGTANAVAFGLTVVVDRNFASNVAIVGDPSGFEIFEQPKGAVQVESTDGSLSRIIKFRGYFATLMIDADKFTKRVAS
jgi:HK97 family phage prohead protease